jgi:cell division protein FtsW
MRVRQTRQRAVLASRGAPSRRHKPDYMLVVLSLVLLIIGLIVIYSISPGLSVSRHVSENYYTNKQLTAIGLGLVTFGIMAAVPIKFWQHMQRPLIGLAALTTFVALLIPPSPDYPAHRWIRLGGFSFQSVELIKFAIIFVLAAFLVERIAKGDIADTKKTFKPLLIVLLVIGVVVAKLQSDLGSTGVMVAMMASMVYVAGLPLRRIAIFGGIIMIGLILAVSTTAYRRDRLLTFVHPERDCLSTGYQACQALIAVGSGGLIGKGLGQSVQAYGYLPEAANDSIFAIYAEKFGFVGVSALVCLFMAFFTRLKNIMERAPDDFSRLVVAGVLAWFSTQALINIGSMIGLLPMKGITLPFISYGGTSIIFVTGAVGLVYNISRYTTYTPRSEEDGVAINRDMPIVRYGSTNTR